MLDYFLKLTNCKPSSSDNFHNAVLGESKMALNVGQACSWFLSPTAYVLQGLYKWLVENWTIIHPVQASISFPLNSAFHRLINEKKIWLLGFHKWQDMHYKRHWMPRKL